MASEWDIHTAMTWLHFARSYCAFMVDTAHEQWFTIARFTSWHRLWWNLIASGRHPLWITTAQYFVFAMRMFLATVCDISDVVRWNEFARNQIALVTSSCNVEWFAIMATLYGAWWKLAIRCWNPAWSSAITAWSGSRCAKTTVNIWSIRSWLISPSNLWLICINKWKNFVLV